MKSIKKIFVVLAIVFSSFIFFMNTSYAYPAQGGLLDGNRGAATAGTCQNYQYWTQLNGSGGYLRDTACVVTFTLESSAHIDGFYFQTSNDKTYVSFYDASNNLLTTLTRTSTISMTEYQPVDISPVKYIRVTTEVANSFTTNLHVTGYYLDDSLTAVPTNIKATNLVESAQLTWDKNTELNFLGYNVYLNGVKYNADLLKTNEITLEGLIGGTNYAVQITSVNFFGMESNKSSVVYVLPLTVEKYPTLEVMNVLDRSLKLSWDKVANTFEIYQNGNLIKTQSFTAVDITGLTPNATYEFYVVAIDNYGRRLQSNVVTTKTKESILEKPVLSISDVIHNKASLSWKSVSQATSYDIYLNNNLVSSQTDTNYIFENLNPTTIYAVKVVAKSPTQQAEATTSFTTKAAPVPTINNAKLAIDPTDKTKRNLSYSSSNGVTAVDVFLNGQHIGTYPVGQDIQLDFADLTTKMADLEIKPTDPNGVGFKSTYPVQTTGHEAIDEITGEMTNQYSVVQKAFLFLAILSVPLILIVVLFFWLRKRLKPMLLSSDDNKPFAPASTTHPKANYSKGKNFAVDRTKDERFVYQPKQKNTPKYKQQGFEIEKYEEKFVPVGFMGMGGYKKKTDITYRKNDVLYKSQYVRGQGRVMKPINTQNQIKHVRNQFQSATRFVTGNYKKFK